MPDLAVASSKRMGPAAFPCAAWAKAEQDRRRTRMNRSLMLASSSRTLHGCAGHVRGSRGFQQDHGDGVLGCGLRAGVASNTSALFAAPDPEESCFAFQGFAIC